MTESTMHDTHRYVKELTNAGLAEPIAQLIADREARLLEHNLATKQDIAQLQQATNADIVNLGQATKTDIERSKNDLMKWLVLTMILLDSLLLAAIKLL